MTDAYTACLLKELMRQFVHFAVWELYHIHTKMIFGINQHTCKSQLECKSNHETCLLERHCGQPIKFHFDLFVLCAGHFTPGSPLEVDFANFSDSRTPSQPTS